MAKHSELTNIHVPYNWAYADETAREAATGFTTADVGKLARQLDDNSLWMLVDDSPETWVQVGGAAAGGGGGSILIARAQRTAGNLTLNNVSTFTDLSTDLDLTIAAVAGDKLGVVISGILDAASGVWVAFDAVSRVSAADVNYISNGTGTPPTLGVPSWFTWDANDTLIGEWIYTVQAGDLSGGNITLRFKYKTGIASGRTLRAASGDALTAWVKNYGQ